MFGDRFRPGCLDAAISSQPGDDRVLSPGVSKFKVTCTSLLTVSTEDQYGD